MFCSKFGKIEIHTIQLEDIWDEKTKIILRWKKIWTNLNRNISCRGANQISWKVEHNIINTEQKLILEWANRKIVNAIL